MNKTFYAPESIRVYVEYSVPCQCYNIDVIREDGKIGHLEFEEQASGFTPPTLQLPDCKAQILMDRLWACGLRPAEGSAGALAATEQHLLDLKVLLEKAYKVQFRRV